jgi:hypothetical protein
MGIAFSDRDAQNVVGYIIMTAHVIALLQSSQVRPSVHRAVPRPVRVTSRLNAEAYSYFIPDLKVLLFNQRLHM